MINIAIHPASFLIGALVGVAVLMFLAILFSPHP
jgi:hypothetical protein